MKLVAGPLVFESEEMPGMGARHVEVRLSEPPGNSESILHVVSGSNKPLSNGASVSQIQFEFRDSTGREPASDALPTSAPNLRSFSYSSVRVNGELNGQFYSLGMDIEHTYSDGMQSDLLISPGKSTFVHGQRFDVALLLPPGSQAVYATSSVNGMRLPMNYPGSCQLAPPNSQNRPTIICPDAQLPLASIEGKQRVDWAVELINDETIENSVEWTVIP